MVLNCMPNITGVKHEMFRTMQHAIQGQSPEVGDLPDFRELSKKSEKRSSLSSVIYGGGSLRCQKNSHGQRRQSLVSTVIAVVPLGLQLPCHGRPARGSDCWTMIAKRRSTALTPEN